MGKAATLGVQGQTREKKMTENLDNLSNAEIEEMGIDPESLEDEQGRGPCCADPLCGCRHYG